MFCGEWQHCENSRQTFGSLSFFFFFFTQFSTSSLIWITKYCVFFISFLFQSTFALHKHIRCYNYMSKRRETSFFLSYASHCDRIVFQCFYKPSHVWIFKHFLNFSWTLFIFLLFILFPFLEAFFFLFLTSSEIVFCSYNHYYSTHVWHLTPFTQCNMFVVCFSHS